MFGKFEAESVADLPQHVGVAEFLEQSGAMNRLICNAMRGAATTLLALRKMRIGTLIASPTQRGELRQPHGMQRMHTKSGRTICHTVSLTVIAVALMAGCAKQSPESMVVSAKDHLAKGDRAAAVIELRNALQKQPDLAEARFLLGSALLENGELASAEKELRQAGQLGYSSDAITPSLARLLVSRGDYKKAIQEFAWTDVRDPKAKAELQTAVGQAYLGADYVSVAGERFAAALAQQPDHPQALLGQTRVTAIEGDLEKALSIVDIALAKWPAMPEAWQLKGDILSAQGQVDLALTAYHKALLVKPDYLPAHSALIKTLVRQGKVDDAGMQLVAMQKVAPAHPETFYLAALLAYRQNNLAAARDATQKQLALTPDNVPGLVLAARIHNRLGSYAAAEADLLKALKNEPKQQAALVTLVDTYIRMDKPTKALEALKPLLSSAEPTSDVLILAGEVYARTGESAKAAAYFQKAATFDPKSATQRRAVALSYLAKGEDERALSELEAMAAANAGIGADLAVIAMLARQRKFDAALDAIAALDKKQPNSAFPHNLRGEMLLAKRDIPGARASFERALAMDATNFPATVFLARMDLAEDKPEEAKKRFDNLLAKDPQNASALLAMADLRARTGATTAEVAATIGKAIAASPADPEPRLALVGHYLTAGSPKLAVDAAQEALSAMPDRIELLMALARAQAIAGDRDSATATCKRVARLLPDSPMQWMDLAGLQFAAKDKVGARESLRKALAVTPDLLEAQRRLVALELDTGAVPSALAIARDVQAQRPKESVGYILEGDIYAKQKAWSDATAKYRSGLKLVGTPDLAIRLTEALRAADNNTEADKVTASWLKEHPGDRAFLSYLAETAQAKKDFAAASRLYKTLLHSNPNDAIALNNLAWVSRQLKDPKALEYAEKANELAPDNAGILDTLTELLLDAGEVKRAIESQQRAVALAPDNADLRLNLARAFIQNGNKESAKRELRMLAKLGPGYPNQTTVAKLMQGL